MKKLLLVLVLGFTLVNCESNSAKAAKSLDNVLVESIYDGVIMDVKINKNRKSVFTVGDTVNVKYKGVSPYIIGRYVKTNPKGSVAFKIIKM